MKLIGSKETGYKLVSSFEKPAKKPKNEKTDKAPSEGGKEE